MEYGTRVAYELEVGLENGGGRELGCQGCRKRNSCGGE